MGEMFNIQACLVQTVLIVVVQIIEVEKAQNLEGRVLEIEKIQISHSQAGTAPILEVQVLKTGKVQILEGRAQEIDMVQIFDSQVAKVVMVLILEVQVLEI